MNITPALILEVITIASLVLGAIGSYSIWLQKKTITRIKSESEQKKSLEMFGSIETHLDKLDNHLTKIENSLGRIENESNRRSERQEAVRLEILAKLDLLNQRGLPN